jgi:DNA-binding NarL/FixJ family response regulator
MDYMVTVSPGAPFVGRAAELERLRLLSAAAVDGKAAAVLVSGDAGVGKTSLIAEAARRADRDGLLVLFGRCVDLGTGSLPYLPFAEALSQLVRAGESVGSAEVSESGRVAPVVRAAAIVRQAAQERPSLARIAGRSGQAPPERAPGDSGLDRLSLFEAVAYVLGRLGDEVAPLLLVIEDLHWADSSTRDLVRFLLSRLGADRLLVVATYRGDDLHRRHPLRPLLGELLRLPQVERMELLPFADHELADFLTGLHGERLPDERLYQITARSAGNAYYAEELLAAGSDDRLPAQLADVLLDRLEQLTPAGQRLVRMASVLGSARIEDSLLRGAVRDLADGMPAQSGQSPSADGDPGMDIEHAVREALAHQLLIPDGPDRYAFRHALLQEAVYADLLPGERVRRHASVAHRLAELSAGDEKLGDRLAAELARHSLAAHDLPVALTASLRAASEATGDSAPAEALAHYEQALQLWDAVPAERRPEGRDLVEIGVAAADVAGDAGLHDRALHLAEAALEEAQCRAGAAQVALARAAVALHSYAVDKPIEARDQARQVIAELDQETPSPARVLARLIEARVSVSLGEADAALEVIPAALAEAGALGLLGARADLLITQAVAHGMAGRPGMAEHWEAARTAADQAGDHAAMVRVLYNVAIDWIDRGEIAAGAACMERAVRMADTWGLAGSLYGAQARSLLLTARWQLGDVDGALAVLRPTGDEDGGSMSGPLPAALSRQLRLFELPIQAVRDPELVLSAGQRLVDGHSTWGSQVLHTARAEAMCWLGRWAESAADARMALDALDSTAEPYPLAGISISVTAVAAYADAAAHARERGDREVERRAVESAAPFVTDARDRGRLGKPRRATMGPEGLAWLARLEAETARLQAEDDEAAWAAVAKAFEGVSVFEVARARWRRAQLLARAGRRDDARIEAVAARDTALRLGAKPLVSALDELARRARLEVVKPADAGLLTPREREVMALVASGLTNRAIGERLFISEKTASVHVSNVLAKLGASGRAEAVAIIGRRGLFD